MSSNPFLQKSQLGVQSALQPGQTIFGERFVLQRHLGQGGMGDVWLANDVALDQPRALKFVLPALLSDAQARKRLRNEARMGTELSHPRIVRVFDFAEETEGNSLAAVVMEFVEGRTLSDLLAEKDPGFFEPEEIETWLNDVIEALNYAHTEKERYHLDLKPGNIIIDTKNNRAKLLDFGISRSAKDAFTRLTGQVGSGTLPYMSPQQLDGAPPCSADDVYGLGATVYELLTGTPPFFRGKLDDQIRSKTPETVVQRRKQNAREGLISTPGSSLSAAWEEMLARFLAKSAERSLVKVKNSVDKNVSETKAVVAPAAVARLPTGFREKIMAVIAHHEKSIPAAYSAKLIVADNTAPLKQVVLDTVNGILSSPQPASSQPFTILRPN